MGKYRDNEGPIQRSCVAYLRRILPAGSIVHHSPNENRRSGRAGNIDRQMSAANGVLPGFPDILIFTEGRGYCLEVKAPKGSLTDRQKLVRDQLTRQGIPYAVVRSVDDVRDVLAEWGVTTKEAA